MRNHVSGGPLPTSISGLGGDPGRPLRVTVLGLPVGDFGLFASALLAGALGLGAFCVSCFVAILSILVYNTVGHHAINFADSYLYVALPIGIAVMLMSGVVLLALWVRRHLR